MTAPTKDQLRQILAEDLTEEPVDSVASEEPRAVDLTSSDATEQRARRRGVTQTQSAPPATRSPSAPPSSSTTLPAPSARKPGVRGLVAAWFEGTPGRMRAFLVLAAAVSVVFGLAAAQGFRQSDGALDRAKANAAQVVRIQAIHTNLVSANADATNAFLVGGLEPPDQRQHYVDSMASAARLISEAASAQPADQKALGELNTTLVTYEGLIEQARANNRQGLPIGSQYLRDANAVLQNDSLPLVNALVDANEKRVDTEFDGVSVRHDLGCRRRRGRAGGLRDHAALAGPPYAPLHQHPDRCRGPAHPADHHRRRRLPVQCVRQCIEHPRRRLRQDPGLVSRPDRGVRRPLQREPHPDRPRLRRRLRQGLQHRVRHRRRRTEEVLRHGRRPDQPLERLQERSTPRSARPTPAATGTTPSRWPSGTTKDNNSVEAFNVLRPELDRRNCSRRATRSRPSCRTPAAACRRSAGSACRSASWLHCSSPGACRSDWRSTDEEAHPDRRQPPPCS